MKYFFFGLFILVSINCISQQKFAKEFSFVSDNDLYVSIQKDQYYSNGLFFNYKYLAKDFGKLEKKIYLLEVGHEIYTPFKSTVLSVLQHDRPFAAHLYGSFGILRAYKSKSLLKTTLQFGIVGPGALGEELQEFIHEIYNFKSPVGWRYQIRNTLAINLNAEYTSHLGTDTSHHLDMNFLSKARIGTIFNEVTAGFMGRIGFKKLASINNSIAFGTNLNDDKTDYVRKAESYLYYKTLLTYVVHDATIEGSLFNYNSPVTFSPKSIRFDLEIGYRFTSNRWNFGYAYHFHTDKLPNLRNNGGNDYGRLFLGYAFN